MHCKNKTRIIKILLFLVHLFYIFKKFQKFRKHKAYSFVVVLSMQDNFVKYVLVITTCQKHLFAFLQHILIVWILILVKFEHLFKRMTE